MSTGKELAIMLGIDGADVISREVYDELPEHRRALLSLSGGDRGYAYLRLPDPPPVAALRHVLALLDVLAESGDVGEAVNGPRHAAREALAEFDGTRS